MVCSDYAKDYDGICFEGVKKLSGQVELNHVSFGYSLYADPLIEDFSLKLTPGKRIALVGESGSGKSTIARLIAGLNQPWSGEILYDGKKACEIPRAVFKSSLNMVNQDIALFHDTMENNIRMWDSTVTDYEMKLAAHDAGIHDIVMSSKEGYRMMLEENGKNLSGGERQRVEIARGRDSGEATDRLFRVLAESGLAVRLFREEKEDLEEVFLQAVGGS